MLRHRSDDRLQAHRNTGADLVLAVRLALELLEDQHADRFATLVFVTNGEVEQLVELIDRHVAVGDIPEEPDVAVRTRVALELGEVFAALRTRVDPGSGRNAKPVTTDGTGKHVGYHKVDTLL